MKANNNSLNNNLFKLFALFVTSIFLNSCSPATEITGSWKSTQLNNQVYNSVVVAALTDNIQTRQVIENNLQQELQARGIKATKSIDLFPPTMMREEGTDAEALMQRITGDGHDAILTVAVVDEKTETRYVPGTTYTPATRFNWYGTFRGYYNYWRPVLYDPGYYKEENIYFLESNLYDAESDQLLWSAQSRSYNPSSLGSFAETFAEITVAKMRKDNVLP
jgi:hypothetical protein